ncbi:MAG: hypothetical protein IT383_06475 [Deltaproteobacteria bacterium]|nr:hypothetical protein [Deltaproteobacteria bacterium]
MRPLAAALLWLAATGALAQGGGDDLGDTEAPPPSAEDLGKTPHEEPAPPPEAPAEASDAAPAAPAAPKRKASGPAAPVAPSADSVAKVAKLKVDLDLALRAEPGDARALEGLAGTWLPDGVLASDQELVALMKLGRGRALLLQKRFDESLDALTDARRAAETLPAALQRSLVAQVKFRAAEVEEARAPDMERCGQALGLKRLARFEGEEARRRIEAAAQRYQAAVKIGDRFWGRRAAFRTAALYEGYYRASLAVKPGLRAASLPSPAAVSRYDESALVADLLYGRWPAEIARLYGEVIASIDARDPDPVLLELVRARAAELGKLSAPEGGLVKSPWYAEEREGLVRYARRYEMRTRDMWLAVSAADAKLRLVEQLGRGPGTIDHAFALAALADAGPPPGTEEIAKALASSDVRARVVGLFAAERHPDVALTDTIITHYVALSEQERRKAFGSVQDTLWSEAARSLLALRALADKDRALAEKLVGDPRLSPWDRAFIVAEIGDARLQFPLQNLMNDRDANAAATALYGLWVTRGKNASGLMRPSAEGPVGCVSRAIQRLDTTH